MSLTELFIIAVGLSMDAFAVSVCKGLSVQRLKLGHALTCGVYFGGFQGLMPALGYLLGSQFQNMIVKVDHWIAFILLGIIGINMIRNPGIRMPSPWTPPLGLRPCSPWRWPPASTLWRWE